MRLTLAVVVVLALLSPQSSADDGNAFAPDGLSSLNAEAEYPIPEGRPLLFCGDRFIALLVVGLLTTEVPGQVVAYGPHIEAVRKNDIEYVSLFRETGARVHFKAGTPWDRVHAADTWTDARAILECLD